MRRNIPDNFSQYSTFIHFKPTFLWGRIGYGQDYPGGSAVKNPAAMQEPQEMSVQSLGWEDPLENMATHSSILAWRIPHTEEAGGSQSWTRLTWLSMHLCCGQNWDLRHGAFVCMSLCVPKCNVCMLVCVCKNVFTLIVIELVLNINFELIVHLICIYIMFLLISPFIFQKILRKKMVKFLKPCYSQTALTWLISWALEIPMLLIYTAFLVLFFPTSLPFPS